MPAVDSTFEFLFKYRRSVFEAGDVAVGAGAFAPLVLASLATALGLSLWSYLRLAARKPLGRGEAILLAGLRGIAASPRLHCCGPPGPKGVAGCPPAGPLLTSG